jgi:hypothetical protein
MSDLPDSGGSIEGEGDVADRTAEESSQDRTAVVSAAEFIESFEAARDKGISEYRDRASEPDYISNLLNAVDLLVMDKEGFQPGDLVKWKPFLKNRRFPDYDRPAVVVELNPGRVWPIDEVGSARFQEPADLSLGIIDGDGDFEVYHYDGRRFTAWT